MKNNDNKYGVSLGKNTDCGVKKDIDYDIMRKIYLNIVFQAEKSKKSWLELMVKVALLEEFAFVHATVKYIYMCVWKRSHAKKKINLVMAK